MITSDLGESGEVWRSWDSVGSWCTSISVVVGSDCDPGTERLAGVLGKLGGGSYVFENKLCVSFSMVTLVTWTTLTNPLKWKIWKHMFSDICNRKSLFQMCESTCFEIRFCSGSWRRTTDLKFVKNSHGLRGFCFFLWIKLSLRDGKRVRIERELKRIYGCRCNKRLKAKTEGSKRRVTLDDRTVQVWKMMYCHVHYSQ